MFENTAQVSARSAGDVTRKPALSGPARIADGRSVAARRLRRIERDLVAGLPAEAFADDGSRALVRHAAELALAAETMRRRMLAGEPVAIPDLVKLENCAARAARAVRAHALAQPKRPAADALAQYIASRGASDGHR